MIQGTIKVSVTGVLKGAAKYTGKYLYKKAAPVVEEGAKRAY